jgi:hypothetical protein
METRTYKLGDKTREYTVYFIEGRNTPAIEEPEAMGLALWAGCKTFTIEGVESVEDAMFYTKAQVERAKQDGMPLPERANRYIVRYSCLGPDGKYYEDLGNAAPDNVSMSTMRVYTPELAAKRARVRVAIFSLGLKGLNADIEFPEDDTALADKVKEAAEFLKLLKVKFEDAGVDRTRRAELLKELGMMDKLNKGLLTDDDKNVIINAIVELGEKQNG